MIPPLQPLRLRSIAQWMKDSDPQAAKLPPEELNLLALEKDAVMMEAFDVMDDEINWKASQAKRQLTMDEKIQEISMGRLEAWQEVCSEFLPISSLMSED